MVFILKPRQYKKKKKKVHCHILQFSVVLVWQVLLFRVKAKSAIITFHHTPSES